MRKSYLFAALLAMGALSSCSNDSENIAPEQTQNSEGREPILLGLGNPNSVSVKTRGTGTVGDLKDTEENVWNGEELYLLMVNKEGTELAYAMESEDRVNFTEIFKNEPMNAPQGVASGLMSLKPGVVTKYYPVSGNFDFFAYHIDDAKAGEIDETTDLAKWTVPFVIDGSQDLMTGKAELTDDQKTLVAGDDALTETECYGAKASRHGIVPNIKFNHLLTRLKFTLLAGDEKASGEGVAENAVRVESITIDSKTTGKMVVAYKGEVAKENLIEWTSDEMVPLTLKERVGTELANLEDMAEVSLFGDEGEGVVAGEALLVSPEEEYVMNITLKQLPAGTDTEKRTNFTVPVKNATGMGFKAGSSYNVKVTLYGLQRIDVNAELTGWEDGGDIPVLPEDEAINNN